MALVTKFRRHAVVNLLRAWQGLKVTTRAIGGALHPDLPKEDIERLKKQMKECVRGKGGEVSTRARTISLGQTYLSLSAKGQANFLELLAESFDIDRKKLAKLTADYAKSTEAAEQVKLEAQLREALTSDRMRILRSFSGLPNGMKFLVDMREDVLSLSAKHPAVQGLEGELKSLLASWFDIGLLDLVQIDWHAPAHLLEKLIEYEAVHAIRSWNDLKNRLDSDRRCFAFFHNKMPDEPLIFVEVALVNGLADSVQTLLDETKPADNPETVDTAIFYSISNAQKGLNGISFGNFLIKRVVDKLSYEFKNLKHFATLSPMPGYRKWLLKALEEQGESLFLPAEKKALTAVSGNARAVDALKDMLAEEQWHTKPALAEAMRAVLVRLGAVYLATAKNDRGKALDPVANFHLTNGARMERINWLADTSVNGLKQSCGLMVNYYYALDDIDENHEHYVGSGRVALGKTVKTWIGQA